MAKKWDKSVQKSEKKGEKVTKRPKVSKSAPKKWDKNVQKKSEKKAKGKVTKSDQNGQKSDKKVQKKGEKMSKKKK